MNAFIGEHFGYAADKRIGILRSEGRQHFHQPPVRPDGRKNLCMFHLTGHHDLRDAFAFTDLDELAEFTQRDPVAAVRRTFHVRRSFFFNGDGNGFVALPAGAFERDHGEASVACDDAVLHFFMTPRSELAMNFSSSSTSAQAGTSD